MAGKIIADQIEHSTAGSLDTQYVVNGTLKAWAGSIDATGTTINNSLNVSSKTDEANTGVFTYALISAAVEQMDSSALSGLGGGSARFIRIASNATTTTNFQLVSVSHTGTNEDGAHNWMFAGELA